MWSRDKTLLQDRFTFHALLFVGKELAAPLLVQTFIMCDRVERAREIGSHQTNYSPFVFLHLAVSSELEHT